MKFKQTTITFAAPVAAPSPLPAAAAPTTPPLRPALAQISGNKRRFDPGEDDDEVAPTPLPKRTRTTDELHGVSRKAALAALLRLTEGYKDKSGAGYPAAKTNLAGCTLVQKAPNRQVSNRPAALQPRTNS
jgi:hypothetical protein